MTRFCKPVGKKTCHGISRETKWYACNCLQPSPDVAVPLYKDLVGFWDARVNRAWFTGLDCRRVGMAVPVAVEDHSVSLSVESRMILFMGHGHPLISAGCFTIRDPIGIGTWYKTCTKQFECGVLTFILTSKAQHSVSPDHLTAGNGINMHQQLQTYTHHGLILCACVCNIMGCIGFSEDTILFMSPPRRFNAQPSRQTNSPCVRVLQKHAMYPNTVFWEENCYSGFHFGVPNLGQSAGIWWGISARVKGLPGRVEVAYCNVRLFKSLKSKTSDC